LSAFYSCFRQHTGLSPKAYVKQISLQKDEVLRLAYVGITRAVSHCYWYVEGQDGQGTNAPKASDRVVGSKAFFDDRRR